MQMMTNMSSSGDKFDGGTGAPSRRRLHFGRRHRSAEYALSSRTWFEANCRIFHDATGEHVEDSVEGQSKPKSAEASPKMARGYVI